MKKIFLIIIIIVCNGCKKTLTYQPPKEDLSTLIEFALNSFDVYNDLDNYLLKNNMKVFIDFDKMKSPLNRKIKYYGVTAENNMKYFSNRENEFLVTVYYLKRLSEKEFHLKYHIPSDNKDVEVKLKYKDNIWQLHDSTIISY